jgi:hypothetical protein
MFIAYICLLALALVFTATQEKVLNAMKPENRLMNPTAVWLQWIPVFNFFWQFVVGIQISRSAANEKVGFKPTLAVGITCSTLSTMYLLLVFTDIPQTIPGLVIPYLIALFASWVVYWILLAQLKQAILRKAALSAA